MPKKRVIYKYNSSLASAQAYSSRLPLYIEHRINSNCIFLNKICYHIWSFGLLDYSVMLHTGMIIERTCLRIVRAQLLQNLVREHELEEFRLCSLNNHPHLFPTPNILYIYNTSSVFYSEDKVS